MKKTVAIIGAEGNMGSAMACSLAKAGYRTLVTDHDQEDLLSLIGKLPLLVGKIRLRVPEADVGIVVSPREASWEADIIIPAVPYEAQAAVASEIKDVVTGKIVISVANPLNDTFDRLITPPSTSAAEELAAVLPHSKVVKAFNTVFAIDFEIPQISRRTADVFVAGDDDEAVSQVMGLVKDAGFNPLLAGKLAMSRTLENMMVLLIGLSARNSFHGPVGWKVMHERLDRDEWGNID
jgi:NADPH-dependent F420 reductase